MRTLGETKFASQLLKKGNKKGDGVGGIKELSSLIRGLCHNIRRVLNTQALFYFSFVFLVGGLCHGEVLNLGTRHLRVY